jgi:hypothetical protein
LSDTEFKTRELERLLNEGKITLDQYLDAKYRVSTSPAKYEAQEPSPHKEFVASPSMAPPLGKKKKSRSKVFFGIILCVLALTIALLIVFYANPGNAENLNIDGYNFDLLPTTARVSFNIKNSGSTDIHISSAQMNGYTSQDVLGLSSSTPALSGVLDLKPGESGVANVYLPPYLYAYISSLIPTQTNPTQEQIENVVSEITSTAWKFTFVTETNREYSVSVPDLGETLAKIWLGSLIVGQMSTEEAKVTSLSWGTNDVTLTVRNTGSTDILIVEGYANGGLDVLDATKTVPANNVTQVVLNVTPISGSNYNFQLKSAQGNTFPYTAYAP